MTEKPGVLQSMELESIRQDLAIEQQHLCVNWAVPNQNWLGTPLRGG